jgi:hypothetical protein
VDQQRDLDAVVEVGQTALVLGAAALLTAAARAVGRAAGAVA